MSEEQNNSTTDVGEERLGAFAGYLRRPEPSLTGMVTQIFGENGANADIILALSLSKFQDVEVFVNIYLLQHPNGASAKHMGTYQNIASFSGFIRRSKPKKDGMFAQFFAPNGASADAVIDLAKTDLQDALVFVDVRSWPTTKTALLINKELQDEVEQSALANSMNKKAKEYAKNEKAFKKANDLLYATNFFGDKNVVSALGDEEGFAQWLLETQVCVFRDDDAPHKKCAQNAKPVKLDIGETFKYMPVCDHHKQKLEDQLWAKEQVAFLEFKHKDILKKYAIFMAKKKFSFDGKSEPDPSALLDWADRQGFGSMLPPGYRAFKNK